VFWSELWTNVKTGLKILMIEDDESDVLRVNHELTSAGVTFGVTRVETETEFLKALQEEPPDLILSDHGLPSFDGFTALQIAQQVHPEIPFIFVSGTFNLSTVVELIENGAAGYVYKNRISELVPAIEEALENAEEQRRRRHAEDRQNQPDLIVREQPAPSTELGFHSGKLVICSRCKRIRNADGEWEAVDLYLRRHREATISLALCPSCARMDY
jgi:DNA-binding NtrC family response regulator